MPAIDEAVPTPEPTPQSPPEPGLGVSTPYNWAPFDAPLTISARLRDQLSSIPGNPWEGLNSSRLVGYLGTRTSEANWGDSYADFVITPHERLRADREAYERQREQERRSRDPVRAVPPRPAPRVDVGETQAALLNRADGVNVSSRADRERGDLQRRLASAELRALEADRHLRDMRTIHSRLQGDLEMAHLELRRAHELANRLRIEIERHKDLVPQLAVFLEELDRSANSTPTSPAANSQAAHHVYMDEASEIRQQVVNTDLSQLEVRMAASPQLRTRVNPFNDTIPTTRTNRGNPWNF